MATVGAAAVVALVHVALVWGRYHVGSFDDDANYILTARALLHGSGLTGHLVSGDSVVSGYPPGFPLLLVPLVWAFGHGVTDLRVASALSYAAVVPLTWYWMGRRRYPEAARVIAVAMIALNPVLATFATMVMAEMPFLLCVLLLVLAVERWSLSARAWVPSGVAVVVLAGGAVWLKEAGIGFVAGVALWWVLERRVRRALAVVAGVGASLVPVVLARVIDHVPLAGARYSSELGAYYGGSLLGRVVHVAPEAAWQYLTSALPLSVLPYRSPLPATPAWVSFFDFVALQATVFCVVGLVVAARRHRDVTVVAVPVYVLETLWWPEINERRVVLVLPFLLAWYGVGLVTTARAALAGARRLAPRWSALWAARRPGGVSPGISVAAVAVAAVTLVVPLVAQLPRDYLFALHQSSSDPGGSRYMAMLGALGAPGDVVETDYRYTTALDTGHATAWNAFQVSQYHCSDAAALAALAADGAGYLLVGDVNKPGTIDSPCLLGLASSDPDLAVRLMRTSRDSASVFELIGPGTGHPGLVDLTAAATVTGSSGLAMLPVRPSGAGDTAGDMVETDAVGGRGTLTWSWATPEPVTQVSLGEAGQLRGIASGVRLQIELPDRAWETVAASTRAVGDTAGHAPFLLATLPPGIRARAVRVAVRGTGPVVALDVAALGPAAGGQG